MNDDPISPARYYSDPHATHRFGIGGAFLKVDVPSTSFSEATKEEASAALESLFYDAGGVGNDEKALALNGGGFVDFRDIIETVLGVVDGK